VVDCTAKSQLSILSCITESISLLMMLHLVMVYSGRDSLFLCLCGKRVMFDSEPDQIKG